MKIALTIAGFDPSSGAGVTADLMVFAAHGLFGTSCITGLTVQSTLGVESSHPIDPDIIARTLACLNSDTPPEGVKIGMACSEPIINKISIYIEKHRAQHERLKSLIVILDPVLKSTSGRELIEPDGLSALRNRLLPLVDWITPNLAELALLTGLEVSNREQVPVACVALEAAARASGSRSLGIIATGGHLGEPDDYLLMPDGQSAWLPGERIQTRSTHGTGCAFSSAFLSRLVAGVSPLEAALGAKQYVAQAMRSAEPIGSGNGPLNLLWPLLLR